MTGGDPRFDSMKPPVTAGLELPFVEQQMHSHIERQLARGAIEISVVGDVDSAHVARLAAMYIGTITHANTNGEGPLKEISSESPAQWPLRSPYYRLQEGSMGAEAPEWSTSRDTEESLSASHWTKVWGRRLHAYVRDSEARAVVHIGGFACNRWGRYPNGLWVWDQMEALQRRDDSDAEQMEGKMFEVKRHGTDEHRKHPAFPRVALWILQELVTKRLFSILREEQRLTYEAAFDVMSFDILWGGVFIITVHTQPEEAERVLEATHLALQQLTSVRPLLQSQLDGAKEQVLSRHLHDRKYARYWLDLLGGLQLADVSWDVFIFAGDAYTRDPQHYQGKHVNASLLLSPTLVLVVQMRLHIGKIDGFHLCRFLVKPPHTFRNLNGLLKA